MAVSSKLHSLCHCIQIAKPSLTAASEDYIRKQAPIFGKGSTKSANLTRYHAKINEAATQLCLQSPSLLSDRQRLLKLSREKVHEEGYEYKKGTSRSKMIVGERDVQTTPKWLKISEDVRLMHMSQLEEDIQDANDLIKIKEKRQSLASTAHQYKDCDKLTSQITALRTKLREHQSELRQLQKRECKSKWYKGKKEHSTLGR